MLIPPKMSNEATTVAVTRPPALATVFKSVPSPSAAIEMTVNIFAVVLIGARLAAGTKSPERNAA